MRHYITEQYGIDLMNQLASIAKSRSAHIELRKGMHRDAKVIWLIFTGRRDWLKMVKTIPGVRYSASYRMWYIAYDRVAYGDFLKLRMPFKYLRSETLSSEKDKSNDIQNSGTTGRAWLKCENTGKKLADVPLECTKQAADTKEYHERRLIVLGSVSG